MKAILASAIAIFLLTATSESHSAGKPILNKTRIETELSARKKHGFKMVKGFTRAGSKAQRFELRHGECGKNRYWNDCDTDRQRIERKEDPKGRMYKTGKKGWYGWSMYLPNDFQDISPANTTLGQVKLNNWRTPIWYLNVRGGSLNVWFGSRGGCRIGDINSFKGKWLDIVAFADYRLKPEKESFVMFLNGKRVCAQWQPIITQPMLRASNKLFFKYGIYNSYVSRWLDKNKTNTVSAKAFTDQYKVASGSTKKSNSPTSKPFRYNWGVKLPTQIVFYDEMRYGSSREQVDLQMLQSHNVKPLD